MKIYGFTRYVMAQIELSNVSTTTFVFLKAQIFDFGTSVSKYLVHILNTNIVKNELVRFQNTQITCIYLGVYPHNHFLKKP